MSLIVGQYYRGDPKIKPNQWGPFSAVQSSLFKNAESIGIDPADIALAMPMWNAGDQVDYSRGLIGANSNVVFSNNMLGFTSLDSVVTIPMSHFNTDYGTVVMECIVNVWRTSDKWNTIFDTYGGANKRFVFTHATFGNLKVYTQTTSKVSVASTPIGRVNFALIWGTNDLYKNGELIADGSYGGLGASSTNLHIGNRYSFDESFNNFMSNFLVFNIVLKDSQIAFLSDNPYYLWQPVPIVFYSIPDSAGRTISAVDYGYGSDSVSITVSAAVSDIGAGVDNFGDISTSTQITDTAYSSDSVNPLISLSIFDSANAVDTVSQILSSLTITDIGAAIDSIAQIIADVIVSDTGSGADSVSLLSAILKTVSDIGSGSDSISIPSVTLSVSDLGVAADLISSITAALSISDSAAAADIINTIKTQLIQVNDTGSGTDSVSMSVSLTVSDISSATDAVNQILTVLSVSDSGSGADTVVKTDFDLLPNGKVKVTFTMKVPGADFTMKVPSVDFTIK